MTGFGVGTASLRSGSIFAEVRSLNHRFLELRVRIPNEMSEHTFFVEQMCRTRLQRGRYDVSVRMDGAALPPPVLDERKARAAYAALVALRDELTPGIEVPVAALTTLPDLFTSPSATNSRPERDALTLCLTSALTALDEMRAEEGSALRLELEKRLEAARARTHSISHHVPTLQHRYERRLRARVERLTETMHGIDEGRILCEVALLAERSDIAEELARLESHMDQFEKLLPATEPVGRRLDFLLQEMAREANTVGAKCQDADISLDVVGLKAELERIREQVQNVE